MRAGYGRGVTRFAGACRCVRAHQVPSTAMELTGWIAADLGSVRSKLFDSVTALVPVERWFEAADGGGSTIAGLLLHLARHQDLAVATAIGGSAPLFLAHRAPLGLDAAPLSAGLAEKESRELTNTVPPDALVAYVTAVFDASADRIARGFTPDDTPPTADRFTEHALLEHADVPWLYGMWGDKPVW